MKLNYDCMRSVLKSLETHLIMRNGIIERTSLVQIKTYKELQKYCEDDIIYSLKQLKDYDYIDAIFITSSGCLRGITVYDILPDGHELLKVISSDTIWKSVIEKLKFVGEVSLPILRDVASETMKSSLGL